jgi:hypothetical protein
MKKIRGNKKRIKKIENWKNLHLKIDFQDLNMFQNDYAKFRLYPWNPVAMSMYDFPQPKGKIRKMIIESFLEIYEEWNKQLKELNKPYYLKIWLFEPDIYMSQVVCAIGDKIDYYENIFYRPEFTKNISKSISSTISEKIKNYDWEYHIEEYAYMEDEMTIENFYDKKAFNEFNRKLNKNHRESNVEIDGEKMKMFLIPGNEVWVGESKASC